MSDQRRTGRTTRLLEEARRLAREDGRAVYVVLATEMARRDAMKNEADRALGIKFESPTSMAPYLDWADMRMKGAHPNCVLLVDHHAIEREFGALLEMLHRFDDSELRHKP